MATVFNPLVFITRLVHGVKFGHFLSRFDTVRYIDDAKEWLQCLKSIPVPYHNKEGGVILNERQKEQPNAC